MLRLNVGGKEFVTSKATLTKFDGYFKNLPEIQQVNPTSPIFVDRSPKHFETILNFMRDGDVDLPQEYLNQLLREARFYGLVKLVRDCEQAIARLDVGSGRPSERADPLSDIICNCRSTSNNVAPAVVNSEIKPPNKENDLSIASVPEYDANQNIVKNSEKMMLEIEKIPSPPKDAKIENYDDYLKLVFSNIIDAARDKISNWDFKKAGEALQFAHRGIRGTLSFLTDSRRLCGVAASSFAELRKLWTWVSRVFVPV